MMSNLPKIIKRGPSKKEKLIDRKHALQKQLSDFGNNAGESQIWHMRAEIEAIDKKLKELDTEQFNNGSDKLKAMMDHQNKEMTTEQMMQLMKQKQAA